MALKPKCLEQAQRLLALDNRLAITVCDLSHKDFGGVKGGLKDVASQSKLLAQDGLIGDRILPIFEFVTSQGQVWMDEDNIEELRKQLEALHELSERLLLDTVVSCECGENR